MPLLLAALPGVTSHDFPAQSQGMRDGFHVGWPAVLERFPDLMTEEARTLAPRLGDRIPSLIRRLTDGDQCLVHADVRLDNVLFDGDQPVLVDWQSVCLSSGEQDLAYFLTQSLADDVWAAHADALVRLYHQALLENGVDDYGLECCRERFRIASLYLLSWAVVIAGTLDMGNERGRAVAQALLARSLRAASDLDALSLLA